MDILQAALILPLSKLLLLESISLASIFELLGAKLCKVYLVTLEPNEDDSCELFQYYFELVVWYNVIIFGNHILDAHRISILN